MKKHQIPNTKEFEAKVKVEFEFLINQFGFHEPLILSKDKEYRDRLVYPKGKIAVEVLNAWHPSDYGFEVNLYNDIELLKANSDHKKICEMVYYKVKEEQIDLSFIEEGARELKRIIKLKLTG